MSAGPDLSLLSDEQKDALIHTLMAQVAALTARVAELEAKLGLPPKTPDNSSVPPSKGQKASEPSKPRPKANPHAGAHRPLHPNPTRERIVSAHVCQDCGADVSNVAQSAVQVYDRIEIPKVEPDVTRVTLRGGVCPCCARRFKAPAPVGLEPGSPFGPNLRAFVIYLRSVQGIPMARLSDVLKDLFDLDISEGALVNILEAARKPFAAQTNLIKQRLLSGTALASDATGLKRLLKRACALGRRRDGLADSTLKTYLADLNRRLDRLLSLKPAHAAGRKLQETIKAIRGNLFVFMTNREIEATNNGSERALRPGAVYRKITNGFRSEWGAAFYADLRSVIETARRRCIRAIDAIRLTLEGSPLPIPA